MTSERATRATKVALRDRYVMSLPEASDYAHLTEDTAREMCLLGLSEMREHGRVIEGWECWRTQGRGEWRIVVDSIHAWAHRQAEREAQRTSTPGPRLVERPRDER